MQFTSQESSKIGIGIDFGTSNSAAAVFDGEQVTLIKLAAPNSVMPSANYIDKSYQSTIGQLAIDEYIDGNTGRTVELSVEVLGEARTGTGGGESAMGGPGESDTADSLWSGIQRFEIARKIIPRHKKTFGQCQQLTERLFSKRLLGWLRW